MAKGRPTDVSAGDGSRPATGGTPGREGVECEACCRDRRGEVDFGNPGGPRSYKRMFMQYARATTGVRRIEDLRYSPSDRWEDFYFAASYGYHLQYETNDVGPRGANGRITIRFRVRLGLHPIPPQFDPAGARGAGLRGYAQGLITPLTQADLDALPAQWQSDIDPHWNNKYTVVVGAQDCPGEFPIQFFIQAGDRPHRELTILKMDYPGSADASTAAGDPHDPQHDTAVEIFRLHRSNAGKINISDSRNGRVIAHEFGHWMGWGDEYIEWSRTQRAADGTLADWTLRRPDPLRTAIRIINPTRVHFASAGRREQIVDLTTREMEDLLMGSFPSSGRVRYSERYVFTIVDDFITLYNRNHRGADAYCDRVLVR